MLLIIMYHRIGEGKLSNKKELFIDHLKYISDHYPVILPGERIDKGLSVCLTFDDAFVDFYTDVFPALSKMNMRAVLAVPTQYILEKSSLDYKKRLSIPYYMASQEDIYKENAPYCTWEELNIMGQSKLIEFASHSHSHPNLNHSFCDFENEISESKKILEKRLSQVISTFVYPFGKCNQNLHHKVMNEYKFAMRIGGALNKTWRSARPLTRINGDNLLDPKDPFKWKNLSKYFLKYSINSLSHRFKPS